jgi:2-methylcitrate dehydratase PrpD
VVFGRILGDAFHGERLLDGLGSEYYISRNYFKLYACSRWNHAPIEAVASLLQRHPFKASDVAEVVVWTYDPAIRLSERQPKSGYAAKHSIPYNLAVRVVHGTNGLDAYTAERVRDPEVRGLAERVTVREDPAMTSMLPDVRPARVDVRLKTGVTQTETVKRPRGGFDNPLTEDELSDKFRQLAGLALAKESVTDLEALLVELPALTDLGWMARLLGSKARSPSDHSQGRGTDG